MRKGEKVTPSEVFPIGTAFREGAEFLQVEGELFQFNETGSQLFEVRTLGFGYLLVTPVEMSKLCGTPQEEGEVVYGESGPMYKEEAEIAEPFIVWNGESNMYTFNEAEVV